MNFDNCFEAKHADKKCCQGATVGHRAQEFDYNLVHVVLAVAVGGRQPIQVLSSDGNHAHMTQTCHQLMRGCTVSSSSNWHDAIRDSPQRSSDVKSGSSIAMRVQATSGSSRQKSDLGTLSLASCSQ